MQIVVKALRFIVLVLSIATSVLVLGVLFLVVQDRRRVTPWQPQKPQNEMAAPEAQSSIPRAEQPLQSPDGDLEWSRDEISMLRGQIENATILALLEMLRDRDGAAVNYQELMDRTGRTMAQVRADLSGFSRVARTIHGHDHWPIETAAPTDGQSNMAYTAPRAYLDWWFQE